MLGKRGADPGAEVSAFDLLKDGPEVEFPVRR